MKSIKFLQFSTATEVLLLVLLGIGLVLLLPERVVSYGQVCGVLSPFLLAQITASFAGNPLKEYIKGKQENGTKKDS